VAPPRKAAHRWAAALLAAVSAGCFWFLVADVAVAATTYLVQKYSGGLISTLALGAGHILGVVVLVIIASSARCRTGLISIGNSFGSPRRALGLIGAIAVLRVAWVLLVPTRPFSDGATYDYLARQLLERGQYTTGESFAYWPPGYPFWLAGVYAVFGTHVIAAKLSAVVLAGVGELCCWLWVRRCAGARPAGFVLLLLVLWPSRTLHLDILSYDDLVLALVMLSLWVMPDLRQLQSCASRQAFRQWSRWVAAGLFLGLAVFTRSTMILIVVALAAWMVLQTVPWRRAALVTTVYGGTALVVLIPWQMRNQEVFGQFVPLTTNAGANLYHSFAPGSDGGYYLPAESHIRTRAGQQAHCELARNQAAMQLTYEVIQADPREAARKVLLAKPALYLGSDNCSAWLESYQSLWPNHAWAPPALKAGGLLLANGFYFPAMLAPLLFLRNVRARFRACPAAAFAFMVFFSGVIVHSIFQAQSRYHLIYIPFWAICLVLLMASPGVTPQPPPTVATDKPVPSF
jgi:4-amino-4-deoxy-L-arabinose transferase-like glycosyltransferase